MQLKQIGIVHNRDGEMIIKLAPGYIPALQGLEGFSHLAVLWWFSESDSEEARSVLESTQPYKNGPEVLGVFATRSPERPNPIALSVTEVLDIDMRKGEIRVAWIDANHASPVVDIKPYTPSADRAENPEVPGWCAHWPKSLETSGDFNWEDEFNF